MTNPQPNTLSSGTENNAGGNNQSPAGQGGANTALSFIREFNRNAQQFNTSVLPKFNRLEAELNLLYQRLNTIRGQIHQLRGAPGADAPPLMTPERTDVDE